MTKAKEPVFHPFADESAAAAIGELTIENRVDRVSLYGSVDLTLDKVGLARARILKDHLLAVVAVLESRDLPDQISVDPGTTVDNPFKA